MIARPKISRNEWKTTEIGAFEVGNFALFSCPGAERRERARYEALLDGAARGGTVGGLYAASGFAWLFSAFGLSYAAAFWFSGRYLFRQGDAAVFDGGGDVIEVFFAAIIGVSSVSDAVSSTPMALSGSCLIGSTTGSGHSRPGRLSNCRPRLVRCVATASARKAESAGATVAGDPSNSAAA